MYLTVLAGLDSLGLYKHNGTYIISRRVCRLQLHLCGYVRHIRRLALVKIRSSPLGKTLEFVRCIVEWKVGSFSQHHIELPYSDQRWYFHPEL